MKTLTLVFTALLTSACASEVKVERLTGKKDDLKQIIQSIANALEAKYNEPFRITDIFFDDHLRLYQFAASSYKGIAFRGKFDTSNPVIHEQIKEDNYPDKAFSKWAKEYFETICSQFDQFKSNARVSLQYKHRYGEPLPALKTLLKRHLVKTIRLHLYLFDVPKNPLAGDILIIQEILKDVKTEFQDSFKLHVSFWSAELLQKYDLEKLSFGFEDAKPKDADHQSNALIRFLSKVLVVKIEKSSSLNLNITDLFKHIENNNKRPTVYNPD